MPRSPCASRSRAAGAGGCSTWVCGERLTRLPDTQCGLKAFPAEVVPALFEPLVANGFAFDVEVLARADRLGLTIVEVPIVWHHVDGSRLSPVRDGLATLREAWRVRRALRREPLPAPMLRR